MSTAEIEALLELLPDDSGEDDPVDDNWYWAAMVMLDLMTSPESTTSWLLDEARLSPWGSEPDGDDDESPESEATGDADPGEDGMSRLRAGPSPPTSTRVQQLVRGELPLGRRPPELALVLARIALAGPGVAALRALSRICGGTAALGR